MREPQEVGRVTSKDSHAFFIIYAGLSVYGHYKNAMNRIIKFLKRVPIYLAIFTCYCASSQVVDYDYQGAYDNALDSIMSDSQSTRRWATNVFYNLSNDSTIDKTIRLNSAIIYGNLSINDANICGIEYAMRMLEELKNAENESAVNECFADFENCRNLLSAETVPYAKRLCGLWVSGERYGGIFIPLPHVFVEIEYIDSLDQYRAKERFFGGLTTDDITILSRERKAQIYFGDKKLRHGNPTMAKSLVRGVGQYTTKQLKAIAAQYSDKPASAGNLIGQTTTMIGGALLMKLISNMAVSENAVEVCDMTFTEHDILSEVALVDVHYTYQMSNSNGENVTKDYHRTIPMYRIGENDTIQFLGLSDPIRNPKLYGVKFPKKQKKTTGGNNILAFNKLGDKLNASLDQLPEEVKSTQQFKELQQMIDYDIIRQKGNCRFAKNLAHSIKEDGDTIFFTGIVNNGKLSKLEGFEDRVNLNPNDSNFWYILEELANVKAIYGRATIGTSPNARVIYEGEWNKHDWHGLGKAFYEDGSRYEGKFSHNNPHGDGTLFYADGRYVKGRFKKGKLDGVATTYDADGNILSCDKWKNGNHVETLDVKK